MLAWIATCFTLYYFALYYKTRGWTSLASALAYALLATYLFITLAASFHPIALIAVALIVTLLHFLPPILRTICIVAYFTLTAFAILFSGMTRLTEERPIAKIVIHSKKVRLESLSGKVTGSYTLEGDLVGIRARIIRFSPFLNFLGFSNICQIDSIHNGYLKMDDHNRLPHIGYAISSAWYYFWLKLFQQEWKIPGIKNAVLQSNYLPLKNNSYYITVTSGGLSCLPALD